MTVSKLIAKKEVQKAIAQSRALLRCALPDGTFGEREEAALAVSNEVVRSLLEEELQELADGYGSELLVDGVPYKEHEPGTVVYHSLCGGLEVTRSSYRQMGVHNGPTVVPLELSAGLAERTTPALAFNLAHAYAQHDMRLHHDELRMAHRVPPSRSTLERVAGRIGEAAVQDAPRLEERLRRGERLPDGASGVSIGLDRTAVAMREPRADDAPSKPVRKRRKPRVRKAPPPTDINWRMAYVGTVSVVNEDGEALVTRRYAAPACDDPRALVEEMAADVRCALTRQPDLHVGIVQDGAPEMWNLTREGLQALCNEKRLDTWHEGIDRYHLSERLAEALKLCNLAKEDRQRLLDEWTGWFDYCDGTIDTIERFLAQKYRELPAAREQLWEHLVYIRNNKDRMRYATLRELGLPIGSGATESAARTLIGQRAKGRSRSWVEPRLRGVLRLRALRQSDRLPRFWSRFARRYTATVEAA